VESLAGVSGRLLLSGYDRIEELLVNAVKAGVQRIALLSSSSVVGSERTTRSPRITWPPRPRCPH
jgi:hypothetical protein